MKIFVAGMNYKTAPVELRERLAVPAGAVRSISLRLRMLGGVSEVVVLSTCNRVEIYGVAMFGEKVDPCSIFRLVAPSVREDLTDHLYFHEGEEALRHLLEVASGMNSMILGEPEITGQVRQAYETARQGRFAGSVLNVIFQKALQTAKEVRTETRIGHGNTSTGSVSLCLARKIFGEDLSNLTVTVIGAGSIGKTCVRHLTKHGVQNVIVCNRSLDKAQELAAEFGGRAAAFEDRFKEMVAAQIVITMTGSPDAIIGKAEMENVLKARNNRPLFLIDIAVPRDVEASVRQVGGVILYDMDDIESIVQDNLSDREADLARCRGIVDRKIATLTAKIQSMEERTAHDEAPEPERSCIFTLPAHVHAHAQ